MTNRRSHVALTAATASLAVLLVACAGDQAAEGDPSIEEITGDWELSHGTGLTGEIAIPDDDHRPTLTIDGQDWGGMVCNRYSATVTVSGSEVSMDGVMRTEMACVGDGIMESEDAYLDAFGRVDEVDRVGRHLVLRGPDDLELVYLGVEAEPDAELTDTTWQLESLVHGDGPDSAVSQAMEASELVLDGDGDLLASTGCRWLAGPYHLDADLLDLTEVGADDVLCDDERLVDQDAHIVATLLSGTGIRVTIEGDRLQLRAPGGQGMDYRAADGS